MINNKDLIYIYFIKSIGIYMFLIKIYDDI